MLINNSFVFDHYTVVYQSSQIQHLDEAKVFILGEIHDPGFKGPIANKSVECKKLNAEFIRKYAEVGSILLLEGSESMEDLESNLSLESRLYKSMQVSKVSEDNSNLIKSIPKDILCTELKKLYHNLLISDYQFDRNAYSCIKKIYGWDVASNYELKKQTVAAISLEGFDIKVKLWNIVFGYLDIERKEISKEIFPNETDECNKNKLNRLNKIFSCLDQIKQEVFPVRTQSMVNSIKHLKEKLIFQGKAFFIAGAQHVKEYNDSDPAFSLDLLYKELEKSKGVALVPKIISI